VKNFAGGGKRCKHYPETTNLRRSPSGDGWKKGLPGGLGKANTEKNRSLGARKESREKTAGKAPVCGKRRGERSTESQVTLNFVFGQGGGATNDGRGKKKSVDNEKNDKRKGKERLRVWRCGAVKKGDRGSEEEKETQTERRYQNNWPEKVNRSGRTEGMGEKKEPDEGKQKKKFSGGLRRWTVDIC